MLRRSGWGVYILVFSMVMVVSSIRCGKEKKSNPGSQKGELSGVKELKESPQEGFLAPLFSSQDLSGRWISLSDLKGKVILLNFWASWCSPCRREIPSLERLFQLRKDKDFEILAVNLDRTSVSGVASFVTGNKMSFRVLLDPQGDAGKKYWVRAIPSSFLLDKKGVIRWRVSGGKSGTAPMS